MMGLFITFEGPEGSGKSTQARMLAEYLQARGYAVLPTREPGGTPIGEQIRDVILANQNLEMNAQAEALLFSAARAQIVVQVIRPALAAGQIVISDRYADSTLAYQGYGLGLELDALKTITKFATGGLQPDLTFYLDLPVEEGLARKRTGELNRLDQKEIDYHTRVRGGYLEMARMEPTRWRIIDARQSVEAAQAEIRKIVEGAMADAVPRR
jgi:dTMP kinase